jgi:cystathionine beta-lyase/cystathionine gamma-synthase
MSPDQSSSPRFSKHTLSVHSGTYIDEQTQGVNTPVFTSTATGYLKTPENVYPRYFNTPNQKAIIQKLCALEQGEDGLVFSSGMAAITTTVLGLLQQGDHALFTSDIYGGTYYFITRDLEKFGISYTFVDAANPEEVRQAIRPETKLLYVETPSNPLLKITDLAAIAGLAREHNLITVIDNTFATPINQNPLTLGIDVVLHSGTKYLGGHSDICCGALVSSEELTARVRKQALHFGGSLDANTCYLLERSLKTLALRVSRHNENALQLAHFLRRHPAVTQVHYPGLEEHPGHDTAKRQMTSFGGMLAFEVDPQQANPDRLVRSLRLIYPALSLGGVESLICSPAQTSHVKLTPAEREKVGITDGLLRLSVGIEDPADLRADLEQALAGARG